MCVFDKAQPWFGTCDYSHIMGFLELRIFLISLFRYGHLLYINWESTVAMQDLLCYLALEEDNYSLSSIQKCSSSKQKHVKNKYIDLQLKFILCGSHRGAPSNNRVQKEPAVGRETSSPAMVRSTSAFSLGLVHPWKSLLMAEHCGGIRYSFSFSLLAFTGIIPK